LFVYALTHLRKSSLRAPFKVEQEKELSGSRRPTLSGAVYNQK